MKMRYLIEAKDRIFVEDYGFLSFAENIGKSLSSKYGQNLLDQTKKSDTPVFNTDESNW